MAPVQTVVNGSLKMAKFTINVLGVIFDSKLKWVDEISSDLLKANGALCEIRMLKKLFSSKQLVQVVTSTFYWVLFYNSEIWHLH